MGFSYREATERGPDHAVHRQAERNRNHAILGLAWVGRDRTTVLQPRDRVLCDASDVTWEGLRCYDARSLFFSETSACLFGFRIPVNKILFFILLKLLNSRTLLL
ncbi:hypothetical protein GWI33_004761 [Rhynchophorus ferrugineus]|uniref:Uncharacterized protein n=1 Tax=Rhynchophorus ferrugineus TaxID=354439 RepID=A0A834IIF4_RHYFE|nr:hypothetical protein GWI33_004761 [Rhynchophorus ferrugineus]